jgi:hypothetical protein
MCPHPLSYVLSQAENGDEQMLGIVKFAPKSMGLLNMHSRGLNFYFIFCFGAGDVVLMVSNE